jgi:hypothetical protein
MKKLAALLVLPFMALGCGGNEACPDCGASTGGGSSGSTVGSTAGSGGTTGSGLPPGDWTAIITADWNLASGSELTSDIHTITLDRDIYVGAIRPIAPPGTHHTLLAKGGLSVGNTIYASGVGTNPLVFPPGVGLKLTAGTQLVLQLHLFNVSDSPLGGTSGIEVIEVPPEDIVNEADLFLPGPVNLAIPANQEHTQTGTCTVSTPQTIFALFPHMHQLGTHFKTSLVVAGQEQVIHDDAYTFDHQAFLSFEPLALNPGDTITSECTWMNTTPDMVFWGESSTTEMCFSILYRYPVQDDGGFCN